ncbi:MAG: DUF309 domain-containing protein [Thermoplasmatales archaeon]
MEKYRFIFFLPKTAFSAMNVEKGNIVRRASNWIEVDTKTDNLDVGFSFASGSCIEEVCVFRTGERESEKDLNPEDGFKLIEEEKYWLGHEFFEKFWRGTSGEISSFFHCLVLICVSMVHFQMGNKDNSERLFRQAIEDLSRLGVKELENQNFSYPLSSNVISALKRMAKDLVTV